MPKIIDKIQKKQDIALSSIELFIEKGFNKLTVGEIASNAKVAKGTIYKYFESKEDIIFAIIEYTHNKYDEEVLENIKQLTCINDKILALFNLCISNDEDTINDRKIYKEFIYICLDNPSENMIKFLKDIKLKYTSWLKEILEEGIKNKQLKPEAINFADALFAIGENILLFSHINNYSDRNMLQNHIDSLLKLIKIGECSND